MLHLHIIVYFTKCCTFQLDNGKVFYNLLFEVKVITQMLLDSTRIFYSASWYPHSTVWILYTNYEEI